VRCKQCYCPDCVIEHDVETCEEMVEAFGEDGE